MPFGKVLALDSGVQFSYTDTGAPSQSSYITVVAIHGMCFAAPIFKKTQAVAFQKGLRFVALNRRNYPGTTDFTDKEIQAVNSGTAEEKDGFLRDRGHEITKFLDKLIQECDLPPISEDGKSGGVILYAWSAGIIDGNAAIGYADSLPSSVQSRLAEHLRSYICYEAAPFLIGHPMPEKNWIPNFETSIPAELHGLAFAIWISSYFEHHDLSKRDHNDLSYYLPSTHRVGSMYNMSKVEQEEILFLGKESAMEFPIMMGLGEQMSTAYRKAFFSDIFPKMKRTWIGGTNSTASFVAGMWYVQKDIEELGPQNFTTKTMPGFNHFSHWDEPEKMVEVILELA